MPRPKSARGDGVVVHMVPPVRKNPYLTLLAEALREQGATVDLWHRPRLRRTIGARRRREVVHVHWPELIVRSNTPGRSPWPLLRAVHLIATLAAARLRGVRTVWTVHNLAPHEPRRPWLDRAVGWSIAKLADSVLAHSQHAAVLAAERFGCRRIEVAYHGNYIGHHPARRTREEARAWLGLPADAHVLLAFGLVRGYKRLPMLIEAFREIPDQRFRLVVAGEPLREADGESVESAAASDPRVLLMLKRIPDELVGDLHAAADVITLAYADVFSSGALMLALSHGVPVIAPANSTATELAPPPAVQPFGPGELGAALARSRPGAAEALAAAQRYTWDEMATKVLGPSPARLNRSLRSGPRP